MHLDLQTTILMICVVYLVLHGAIWIALSGQRSWQVTTWAISGIVSGVAVVLMALKGELPEYVFYYVAQLLMALGNFGRILALRLYMPSIPRRFYISQGIQHLIFGVILVWLVSSGSGEIELMMVFYGFYTINCLEYFYIGKDINRYFGGLGAKLLVIGGLVLSFTLGLRFLGVTFGFGAEGFYGLGFDQYIMIAGQVIGITMSNIGFLKINLETVELRKLAVEADLARSIERSALLAEHSQELETILRERQEIIRQLTLTNKSAGMGALVASFAHELNQPLGAIRLNAQFIEKTILENRLDPSQAMTVVKSLINDNVRASEIIRKLRNMFSSQGGEFSAINFSEIINDTVDLVSSKARLLNIEIEINILPKAMMMGDKTQLQQVILNLLNNALDALESDHEKPNKKITLSFLKQSDQYVLTVRDNGLGIAEDVKQSIFELFKTTKADGMGIGLWLSQAVVRAHGGDIFVNSELGQGTVFEIHFPTSEGIIS